MKKVLSFGSPLSPWISYIKSNFCVFTVPHLCLFLKDVCLLNISPCKRMHWLHPFDGGKVMFPECATKLIYSYFVYDLLKCADCASSLRIYLILISPLAKGSTDAQPVDGGRGKLPEWGARQATVSTIES